MPPQESPQTLTDRIKAAAAGLGFDLCGVAPAVAPPGAERLDAWLAAGYAGQMNYLADRRDAYHDPNRVLAGVRSVVMLGLAYRTAEPVNPQPGEGRVSRYAWGERDYHDVLREKLHTLADELRRWRPEARTRCVVDTAPLLERDFARLAGLGWVGKNTLLLAKPSADGPAGSYYFLAGVLTDAELAPDTPMVPDHCGSCTACLDACPTDAFPQPYVLDARKCISYLTIELRDAIPMELREGVGEWLFGCDVCQDVCPWNNKAPQSSETAFEPLPAMNPVELAELFDLDDEAFRQRFRKTPLWRAHRDGLLRNAAIVLGNQKPPAALAALAKGLDDDAPLVRGACAWALGRFGGEAASAALRDRQREESDAGVIAEIEQALAACAA